MTPSPATRALLRQVLDGGEPARERLRTEVEAAAAALKERQAQEQAQRLERFATRPMCGVAV